MLLCCYLDDENIQHFDKYPSIEDFTKAHPGIAPTYVFDMDTEMTITETVQRQEFDKYCSKYGFTPEDYGRHTLAPNNEECILTGFHPQNRKYTIQLVRVKDGHRYKATPDWTRDCMTRYDNAQKINF